MLFISYSSFHSSFLEKSFSGPLYPYMSLLITYLILYLRSLEINRQVYFKYSELLRVQVYTHASL